MKQLQGPLQPDGGSLYLHRSMALLLALAMIALLNGCAGITSIAPSAKDTTAPTAPANLTATVASSTQVNLAWTPSTDSAGVTGYMVEHCVGNACTGFSQVGTTSNTNYTDTGLAADTNYGFRVRATDAAGNLSAYSNISYVKTSVGSDTTPPTAPNGLTATAASSMQINLNWTASTDNVGVTGYKLERCSGAGCSSFLPLGTTAGSTTTYSDSGLSASTSYSYRVRATDAAGNLSGYSNAASATTSAATDTTPPTAPSGLTATAASSTQINLNWTASTDNVAVTGYKLERCSGAGCSSFAQVGTTGGSTTTYSDSGLSASTSYSYRVRATDAAGNLSGYSNTATAITQSGGGSNITVSVTPQRGGITTSQTLSLTATLTNDATNAGVTWSSNNGGSFSACNAPPCSSATFTPSGTPSLVKITATSVADPTKSATAMIGVTDLAGVTTYHNNPARDGTNQQEYALTTANVAAATFGKLFSCKTDGAIYAQPLWVPNLRIGSSGTHNVIFAATTHDSVYAFDADANPCVTYWHVQLIGSGETYGNSNDVNSGDIAPDIGIIGTPVIDASTNALYVVSKTKTIGTLTYHQRLHALNLLTGAERSGGAVDIDSTIAVPGACDGGVSIAFNPLTQNQRTALALAGGVVYVGWASHGDNDPYHGWLIGFNESTLGRASVFNSTPNAVSGSTPPCRGGFWMSGGAPAVDSSNNLYLATGNGIFDANSGGANYGDTVLKLTSGLAVSDWFTPNNQVNLSNFDADLGSGGTVLVDQTASTVPHVLIVAGKGNTIYVINRDNGKMGGYSTPDNVVQELGVSWACFSTPAFWQNKLYYAGGSPGTPLQAYGMSTTTSQLSSFVVSASLNSYGFPGSTPSVSSTGSSNGIVWTLDNSAYCTDQSTACGPTVLHAYDATNLATELWNSGQNAGDTGGYAVKFTVPTVANGKVYVGTRGTDTGTGSANPGELDVYGLKPN